MKMAPGRKKKTQATTPPRPTPAPVDTEIQAPSVYTPLTTPARPTDSSVATVPTSNQSPEQETIPTRSPVVVDQTSPWMPQQPTKAPWEDAVLTFQLDHQFMTSKFPQGLNMSSDYQQWLSIIGVYDMDDLFHFSQTHTVKSLMTLLTIPVYHRFRNDLLIFLKFGELSSAHGSQPQPSMITIISQWIPLLIKKLKYDTLSGRHSQLENQAMTALTTQDKMTPRSFKDAQSQGGYSVASMVSKDDEKEVNEDSQSEEASSISDDSASNESNTSSYMEETVYSDGYTGENNKRGKERRSRSKENRRWRREASLRRGENYPAYRGKLLEKDYRNRYDSEDRLITSHTSYSLSPQIIKSHLPAKIQWDGSRTGFQEYRYAIEGFYTQCQSSYLFDERFHKLYVRHGPGGVIDHPNLPRYIKITRPQLEEAKIHLYGAIQQSTRKSNTALKFITRYRDERDGLRVWIDLLNSLDHDGNKDVRESRLVRITTQLFSPSYPGGLEKYVDDIDDAFSGLCDMGNRYTSRQKIQCLLNNLQLSGVSDYLISHCRDNFTKFHDCVNYLRKEAVRRADVAAQVGSRKARMSVMEETPTVSHYQPSMEDILTFCQDNGIEIQQESLRQINLALQRNPAFYVPKQIYDLIREVMTQEQLKLFLEKKNAAEKASPLPERPNENIPPVAPRQYQREANVKMSQVESDSDSDSNSIPEHHRVALAKMAKLTGLYEYRSAMTVQRVVQASTTTSVGTTKYHRLIFDTGADTCVIGLGWKVTHYYGPLVNLVGFDSVYAKKKHLRLCSALTVVEHPKAGKFLLRIHQAVHNPDAQDTLLSEYQLNQGGCKIDSKSLHHEFPDGSKGTQSWRLPGLEEKFKFNIDSCLITYPHRMPNDEEAETLIPIDITLMDNWNPQDHTHSAMAAKLRALCIHDKPQSFFDEEQICLVEESKKEELSKESLIHPVLASTIFSVPRHEDTFLNSVPYKDLPPNKDPYDIVNYIIHAYNTKTTIIPKRAMMQPINPVAVQPCLAFLPLDVIKKTLDCTTQLVKWHVKVPMQRHWRPRFPFMNVHRLREPVATDTFFASAKAIGGATCAQVFYGIQSCMINVYPMQSESHGPNAYEDFIREEGCPTLLRRDNAKMQTGHDFTAINRHYCIKDGLTEPHHPHQNPAENQAVRWLKHHCQTVMNLSGAPSYVWSYCMTWISDVHNITAKEALEYRTPYEKRHGVTPDISAYLMFTFWEKILYLDTETTYPYSKELPGYFLGVAKSSGDALTFQILTDLGTVLVRSVIRSALGKPLAGFPNKRTTHQDLPDIKVPPYPDHAPAALLHIEGGDKGSDDQNELAEKKQISMKQVEMQIIVKTQMYNLLKLS